MRASATQLLADVAPAKKRARDARRAPASPANVTPITAVGTMLQRRALCACGGGCPRCRQETERPALQTKLKVSAPGDQYEQEADRVAEQVMRMPDSHTEPGAAISSRAAPPTARRKCAACSGASPQAGDGTFPADLLPGAGRPLADSERAFFEPRFGQDFGHVRVHVDTRAAELARSVNARAYTVGRDIVFGAGQYAPGTAGGRLLLAHELTHVLQQSGAGRSRAHGPSVQRQEAEGEGADDEHARKVVINNPRIDVRAQFALLRLLRGPDAATAREIIDQIEKETLKGIYGDDLKKAADIAAPRGKPRWELVPKGEDAVWLEDGGEDVPVIIFRESAGGPPRLDRALIKAYRADPAVVSEQCPGNKNVPPGCAFSEAQQGILSVKLEEARSRTREVSELLARPGGPAVAEREAADMFASSDGAPPPTRGEIALAVYGTLTILESSTIQFVCRTCGDPVCNRPGNVAYVVKPGQMPIFICAFRMFMPGLVEQLRRTIIHEAVHLSGIDTDTSKDEKYCEHVPACGGPCNEKDNAETWARYIDCLGVPSMIPPPLKETPDTPIPPRPATLPGLGEP